MFKKIISWFIKKAWPIILAFLLKYADEIIRFVVQMISRGYNESQRKKAEEAMEKARENHQRAQETSDEFEKKEYKFKSDFYKEEAQKYADDIMKMSKVFQELEEITKGVVKTRTEKLRAEDLFNTESEDFELKPKNNYLSLEEGIDKIKRQTKSTS